MIAEASKSQAVESTPTIKLIVAMCVISELLEPVVYRSISCSQTAPLSTCAWSHGVHQSPDHRNRREIGTNVRLRLMRDTFSCGCLLILEYHSLSNAQSSIGFPGGSERSR